MVVPSFWKQGIWKCLSHGGSLFLDFKEKRGDLAAQPLLLPFIYYRWTFAYPWRYPKRWLLPASSRPYLMEGPSSPCMIFHITMVNRYGLKLPSFLMNRLEIYISVYVHSGFISVLDLSLPIQASFPSSQCVDTFSHSLGLHLLWCSPGSSSVEGNCFIFPKRPRLRDFYPIHVLHLINFHSQLPWKAVQVHLL